MKVCSKALYTVKDTSTICSRRKCNRLRTLFLHIYIKNLCNTHSPCYDYHANPIQGPHIYHDPAKQTNSIMLP